VTTCGTRCARCCPSPPPPAPDHRIKFDRSHPRGFRIASGAEYSFPILSHFLSLSSLSCPLPSFSPSLNFLSHSSPYHTQDSNIVAFNGHRLSESDLPSGRKDRSLLTGRSNLRPLSESAWQETLRRTPRRSRCWELTLLGHPQVVPNVQATGTQAAMRFPSDFRTSESLQ
jgi:hypothetical protein